MTEYLPFDSGSLHVTATPQSVDSLGSGHNPVNVGHGSGHFYYALITIQTDILAGATISAATLNLWFDSADSGFDGFVYANKQNNSPWTTDPFDANSKINTRTDAITEFFTPSGGSRISINVADIVQELVDLAGYEPLNYITFIITWNAANTGIAVMRTTGDDTHGPMLDVSWSGGTGGGTADGPADDDGYWATNGAGAVGQGGNYLTTYNHLTTGPASTDAAIRFPGGVPKDASIVSATLRFTHATGPGSTGIYPCDIRVYAVDRDDVPTFPTTASDALTMIASLTTAHVSRTVTGSFGSFTDFDLDVKAIIEELVARSGWSFHSRIVFYFTNDTGDSKFMPASIESGSPITLTVVWGSGGGGTGPGGQIGTNAAFLLLMMGDGEC